MPDKQTSGETSEATPPLNDKNNKALEINQESGSQFRFAIKLFFKVI